MSSLMAWTQIGLIHKRLSMWPIIAIVCVATSLSITLASAHPSVSLVMDSRGVVFYSDLIHVWMILPDGSKQIAVPNVHTHELWLDPNDTLYGEDVTNEGERYQHRVWKRQPDGTLSNEIPWREGHPVDHADYAFARDQKGHSYILRHKEKQIDVRGQKRDIRRTIDLSSVDGYPHWLIVDAAGDVYLTVGAKLLRLQPGDEEAVIVAQNLVERVETFGFVHDRHALMGLWTNISGDVFVAVYAGQMVKRITPEGTVSVAAKSEGDWSISGGLVAPDGALWLLEYSRSNQVRIRRIGRKGNERVF